MEVESDVMSEDQMDTSDVIRSIERNNLKLSADKILQGLKKVRNEPSKSRRRWIWELVQNAKDVPNHFGRVRIKVGLTNDELNFSHNGDPFTVGNITGLIQQVSTKASGGDDEEVTGKFGTGFISTHLLSEQATVQGVTVRPDGVAKRFTIELDRSGRTSEELIPHIEAAIERIKGIDQDPAFEEVVGYAEQRTADDLDTSLCYRFHGKQGMPAAQVGLDDLRNTLPFTLANVPKIEAVSVVDATREIEVHFACAVEKLDDHVRSVCVTIQDGDNEEQVHFLCWDGDGITLMVELSDPDTKALKPNFGVHPTLYRQFPLIGSEKFHWPFMVNGDAFFPTEDREGLFLNSDEDEDSLANRALLEQAVDEAVAFANWLIEYGVTDRYVMAYTRIPDIAWEAEAKDWYKGVQASWRERLMPMALIENGSGAPTAFDGVCIPKFGAAKEVRELFWDLFTPIVGHAVVPLKAQLHDWIEAVGPESEIDSWGDTMQVFYDLEELFRLIAEKERLDAIDLGVLPEQEKLNILGWLLSVMQFAIEHDETELLSEHAVVPNHSGALFKLSELYEEDASMPIPDPVLDILEKLGVDWRAELIHREIRLEGLKHQGRGLRDASETVGAQLMPKKEYGQGATGSPFLKRGDALDILFEILSMVPPGARDSFQSKLFKSASFLFGHEGEPRKVEGIADFNFAPALRLMIEAVHGKIAAFGSIAAMAEALEVAEDRIVNWLDDHLRLIEGNSEYEHYLKVGDIVPNRQGAFMAFEDVYAYGTEETPLDPTLVEVLHLLDAEQDWNEVLVADGIGISLPNTRTMEELGSAIQKAVAAVKVAPQGVKEKREPLLQLIDWCEQNEVGATRHLSGFLPHKDALFFELVAKDNIGSSVIRMLGSEAGVSILKRIAESNMDAVEVDKLLDLGQELGSLSEIIERAEELVEDQRDFEYKKQLGFAVESAFKQALEQAGIEAEVKYVGKGGYDMEVIGLRSRKSFKIELKSLSTRSTDPLKVAASQASGLIREPNVRALCVLERTVPAEEVTVDHIRESLKYNKGSGLLLQDGLTAHGALQELLDGKLLEVQVLGSPRLRLERDRFMNGATGFAELVEAIKEVVG